MSGQFPEAVKRLIRRRAQGCCERCGRQLITADGDGQALGVPYSFHHRRIKGMGGDPRPETNKAANGLLLCGTGTTLCHGRVHHEREEAREAGWTVSRELLPAQVWVRLALHGPALITDRGDVEQVAA